MSGNPLANAASSIESIKKFNLARNVSNGAAAFTRMLMTSNHLYTNQNPMSSPMCSDAPQPREQEQEKIVSNLVNHAMAKALYSPKRGYRKDILENFGALVKRFDPEKNGNWEKMYEYAADILDRIIARSSGLLQINSLLIAAILLLISQDDVKWATDWDSWHGAFLLSSLAALLVLMVSSMLTLNALWVIWDKPSTLIRSMYDFAATQSQNVVRARRLNLAIFLCGVALTILLVTFAFRFLDVRYATFAEETPTTVAIPVEQTEENDKAPNSAKAP